METVRNNLVYLRTEKILPHPKNPRKELGDLTEMAERIKANGIMQNLTVVEVGDLPTERIAELGITAEQIDGGYFMAVIGHRRLGAAKLAGLPASVITRARQILQQLEEEGAPHYTALAPRQEDQISMLDLRTQQVCNALCAISVETLTPIEAMNALYKLQEEARKESGR